MAAEIVGQHHVRVDERPVAVAEACEIHENLRAQCAYAYSDGDCDLDVVLTSNGGRARLCRNDGGNAHHWIRLKLVGTKSNRDAIGTRIEAKAGDLTIHRQRKGGFSLESSNDPRVLIGLGPAAEVARLTIRWPSGAVTTREHLKTNQAYEIVEGR